MTSTPATAENNTLFEIDEELEGRFDDDAQELEQTGIISEETKQRCLDLFTELGKKVDRIGRYVRATEYKAKAAKEEATRLTARQKAAENRVEQVKSMLAFYMLSRGLRRLEGELNTIRLQKTWATHAADRSVCFAAELQPEDTQADRAGLGTDSQCCRLPFAEIEPRSFGCKRRARQGTDPPTLAGRGRCSRCITRKRRPRSG